MLFYIKTQVPPKLIYPYVRRYLDMYITRRIERKPKGYILDKYVKNVFGISLNDVFKSIKNHYQVGEVKKNLLQIYFDVNAYVGTRSLSQMIDFLEYGNMDIKAPKIISSMFKYVLNAVRDAMGGC